MADKRKKTKRQVKIDEDVVLSAIDRIATEPDHTGKTIGGYFESLHIKDINKDGHSNPTGRTHGK